MPTSCACEPRTSSQRGQTRSSPGHDKRPTVSTRLDGRMRPVSTGLYFLPFLFDCFSFQCGGPCLARLQRGLFCGGPIFGWAARAREAGVEIFLGSESLIKRANQTSTPATHSFFTPHNHTSTRTRIHLRTRRVLGNPLCPAWLWLSVCSAQSSQDHTKSQQRPPTGQPPQASTHDRVCSTGLTHPGRG